MYSGLIQNCLNKHMCLV